MNPAARRRTGVALDAPIEHLTLADLNPPQTLEKFISQADVMLYQAKGAGRNYFQVALRLIEGGRA